jgi:hypothetical protein
MAFRSTDYRSDGREPRPFAIANARLCVGVLCVCMLGCASDGQTPSTPATPEQARTFLATVDRTLTRLWIAGSEAG